MCLSRGWSGMWRVHTDLVSWQAQRWGSGHSGRRRWQLGRWTGRWCWGEGRWLCTFPSWPCRLQCAKCCLLIGCWKAEDNGCSIIVQIRVISLSADTLCMESELLLCQHLGSFYTQLSVKMPRPSIMQNFQHEYELSRGVHQAVNVLIPAAELDITQESHCRNHTLVAIKRTAASSTSLLASLFRLGAVHWCSYTLNNSCEPATNDYYAT